tara:strand:- start:1048 stop:1302 length:255 start_codon:yes stop_codon:yes gene_type:complete
MKKILKPIPILSCIIVLLLIISISKTQKINILKEEMTETVYDIFEYENIDSLYSEIMALGAEIDSLKIKNKNQEYFIEQIWNNQ